MSLELTVKIISWVLVIVPTAAFLSISTYMIIGAAKDDAYMKGIIGLAATLWVMGALFLSLIYFTDLFASLIA